jgi:hypothetical protein
MIEISTLGLLDWNCLLGFFGLKWAIWGIPDRIEKIGFVGLKSAIWGFLDWIQVFRFVGLKSAIWGFLKILNSDIWVCWIEISNLGFLRFEFNYWRFVGFAINPLGFFFWSQLHGFGYAYHALEYIEDCFALATHKLKLDPHARMQNILENIHMHKLCFHTQNLTNLSLRFRR